MRAAGLEALDPAALEAAFSGSEGLTVILTSPAYRGSADEFRSASVWRKDLPLALYDAPGPGPPDEAGIILHPGRVRTLCAYPVDAMSDKRTAEADSSHWPQGTIDRCGVTGYMGDRIRRASGACDHATPELYAQAYHNRPQHGGVWALNAATCHFEGTARALDAQAALLRRSLESLPEATSEPQWLRNATSASGLTAWNEAVLAPFPASSVGGMFWAHPGPLREPRPGDQKICAIARHLGQRGDLTPAFEFAQVNLERPFTGCYHGGALVPDCLRRGLQEWQANVSSGGYRAHQVFRLLDPAMLRGLLESGGLCA